MLTKNDVLKYVKNKLVHQSCVYDFKINFSKISFLSFAFKLYNFLLLYRQKKINK